MNLPAEALEMDAPLRLHRVELRRDSGGAGEYRGGLGVIREYEVLADDVSFTHRGERHFSAAPGLAGGLAGASAHSVIVRADGREEVIPSKALTVLNKGDRVIVETPGGGGYGDPSAPHGCRGRRERQGERRGSARALRRLKARLSSAHWILMFASRITFDHIFFSC